MKQAALLTWNWRPYETNSLIFFWGDIDPGNKESIIETETGQLIGIDGGPAYGGI